MHIVTGFLIKRKGERGREFMYQYQGMNSMNCFGSMSNIADGKFQHYYIEMAMIMMNACLFCVYQNFFFRIYYIIQKIDPKKLSEIFFKAKKKKIINRK